MPPFANYGTRPELDWYSTVFELIDMRSFSNLWYWIGLAVVWSSSSHWVLGVPYDMIQRAKRQGGQAQTDLQDMVRVNVNRLIYIRDVSGVWIVGFGCFLLTMLLLLGFLFQNEFAQAVFLLAFPMSIVGLLSVRSARIIHRSALVGEDLHKRMLRHRFQTQLLGVVAIFVTAMWGMYQNFNFGALGG